MIEATTIVMETKVSGGQAEVERLHRIHAEDVKHDADGGEHADLDDRDGVEQGADRRGGDHGAGEPIVEGHHGVLGEAENAAGVQGRHHPAVNIRRQDAGGDVVGEVEVPLQDVDQDHGRQHQALGGAGQIGEVFPAALVAFLVLVVGDQGIGADADNLVEKIQGKQVVGEGAADGAEQGQGEAGVEARLLMLVEAAHITRRVEHSDDPQERGGQREDHRERIRPQRDA